MSWSQYVGGFPLSIDQQSNPSNSVVIFDPISLRIIVRDVGGDNEVSVLEIFSEWKDWLLANPGARLGLPQAFTVIGGEPKSPTLNIGQSFFLHSEWKIRPAERDHRLVLTGDIQVLGGVGSIIVPTLGEYTVLVEVQTSAIITDLARNRGIIT